MCFQSVGNFVNCVEECSSFPAQTYISLFEICIRYHFLHAANNEAQNNVVQQNPTELLQNQLFNITSAQCNTILKTEIIRQMITDTYGRLGASTHGLALN